MGSKVKGLFNKGKGAMESIAFEMSQDTQSLLKGKNSRRIMAGGWVGMALTGAILSGTSGVSATNSQGLKNFFDQIIDLLQEIYQTARPFVLALWLAITVFSIVMILVSSDDRKVGIQKDRIKRTTIALFIFFFIGSIASWVGNLTDGGTDAPWDDLGVS